MVAPKKKVVKSIDKGVPVAVKKVKGGFEYHYKDGSKKFITRKEYFK